MRRPFRPAALPEENVRVETVAHHACGREKRQRPHLGRTLRRAAEAKAMEEVQRICPGLPSDYEVAGAEAFRAE